MSEDSDKKGTGWKNPFALYGIIHVLILLLVLFVMLIMFGVQR